MWHPAPRGTGRAPERECGNDAGMMRECGSNGSRHGDIPMLFLVSADCPQRGRSSGSSLPVLPAGTRRSVPFQLPGMMDTCQSRPGSGRGPQRERAAGDRQQKLSRGGENAALPRGSAQQALAGRRGDLV